MNYLTNFLNLLLGYLGGSLSPSSMSSGLNLTATSASVKGADNIAGDHPFLGTTTVSSASAVTTAASEAYNQTNYEINTSQAYVQSLNEDELKNFIGSLEEYDIQINDLEYSNPKVLSKTKKWKR